MKRLAALVILWVGLSGSASAQDFPYYWPLIKSGLFTNSILGSNSWLWITGTGYQASANAAVATNWIGATGSLAAVNARYATNWIAVTGAQAAVNGSFSTNWIAVTGAQAAVNARLATNWITGTGLTVIADSRFSTNWIASTGTVAYVAALYASNWIAAYTPTPSGGASQPSVGIWASSGTHELAMLPNCLQVDAAGFWKMNDNYDIVLSTNRWHDRWWTTNASGDVVMRSLP